MEMVLRNSVVRKLVLVFSAALFVLAVMWGFRITWAWRVAQTPTLQNLQRAVSLDPDNAEHHLRLARLYQYSVEHIDSDRALEHLMQAVQLSPYDARVWLELGAALQLEGKLQDAEVCLRRADFLAPNIPSIQWAIGNFFLLQGNLDDAFRHFRVVLAGTSQYNQILFSTAWKASGDPEKILRELIPNHLPTELTYLYYLLGKEHYEEASGVWRRVMTGSEKPTPAQAGRYLNDLIRVRRAEEAYQVWSDLIETGSIKGTYQVSGNNLIVNGNFEEELLRVGFDWRIGAREAVYTGLDGTVYRSPSHSILIQFSGKENFHYRHLSQTVRVRPRQAYRLQAYMRAEGITTDSGPRLEVRDAYDPRALRALSEDLTGTTPGWVPVSLEFTTGPATELIVVSVTRVPSRKLDNLIAGRVWVDDFVLEALSRNPQAVGGR